MLQEARDKADGYRPDSAVLEQLRQKTFVALVGPAGVGKSTTGDVLMAYDTNFGRTGSVTTRQPEPRDTPALYRYITMDDALSRIKNRQFVNYVIHPTTKTIYGTDPDMYDHRYTVLETLPEAVAYFRRLPFKHIYVVYLVTDADEWKKWFDARYALQNEERSKRLDEATHSLGWALFSKVQDIRFVYNPPGDQQTAARTIIDLVKYSKDSSMVGREFAERMLAITKEMA